MPRKTIKEQDLAAIERFPLAYSKRQAAKELSVCTRTVDKLIAENLLRVKRIGRRRVIPRTALLAFLRK